MEQEVQTPWHVSPLPTHRMCMQHLLYTSHQSEGWPETEYLELLIKAYLPNGIVAYGKEGTSLL